MSTARVLGDIDLVLSRAEVERRLMDYAAAPSRIALGGRVEERIGLPFVTQGPRPSYNARRFPDLYGEWVYMPRERPPIPKAKPRTVLGLAGITVPRGACVHHINGNSADNRIENLAIVAADEHG